MATRRVIKTITAARHIPPKHTAVISLTAYYPKNTTNQFPRLLHTHHHQTSTMSYASRKADKASERKALFNMQPSTTWKSFSEVGRRDSQNSVSSTESDREEADLRLMRRGAACGEELLRHHRHPSGM